MSWRYKIIMIALVLTSLSTRLSAGSGLTCSDPIELIQGYESTITGPCTRYYVANTFDLPLAISFYPYSTTAPAPELYLDFSCTSGIYEDSILCSLFCTAHSAHIAMPYKQIPALTYDDENNPCYRVAFGEFYRDLLLQQGIDYNVPVYVQVVYGGGGRLMMDPDAFNNCMDGAKFMHLGDTVQVAAFDVERHVIVPYVQWQYDSIRYVWQGTQPCQFAVGNKCNFDPTTADPSIVDAGTIQPGGAFKVSSELLMEYVSDQVHYPNDAGMYFAKFYSEAPGIMKIEKIPSPPPAGEAELLRYGVTTDVYRDDTSHVYAIPSSWVKPMMFTTPTPFVFKMYVGTTPDFYTTEAIATYQFDRADEGHELFLFASDMAALWRHKVAGQNYLYVRFECGVSTTVTPALWSPSACVEHTTRIEAGKQFEVAARSTAIYRLFYDDWKGGDMTISWTSGQAACAFFLSDTCEVPNSVTPPVFYTGTIPKRGSAVCTSDTIDSWEPYVDPDGYLYMRFYSSAKAKITLTTAAPPEVDPDCNTYDSIMIAPAWDSYTWRGKTYTKSGNYISEGTADPETGCVDTVFRLHVTFYPTEYAEETLSACDTILYNGQAYTESGEYNDTTMALDSTRIITALHLTVMHSSYTTVVIKQKEVPYESPQGIVYTKTGKYIETLTNAIGCDSVITYDVTIYTTEYETIVETGCDSIVSNHKTYTESGVYHDTIQLLEGNTIIRTLELTIHHTTYAEQSKNACEVYTLHTGQRVTESGDYMDTLPNREGCDSVITLHLVILEDCYRTVYFCQGMNWEHTEEQNGLVLTYRHYEYEEPDPEWYMEGVILTREEDRTLVDFAKAEANLYNHYTDEYVPIKSITWTYRPLGEMAYNPMETTKEPQWVASGSVSMTVRFLCGQVHSNKFTTDVDMVSAEAMSGQKLMENGQLVIIRGGARYTILGARIE